MRNIIVVDDSAVLRTTIQNALNSAGFNVIGTTAGSDGLFEMLAGPQQTDLLLLDMFFPDESGMDILRAVKEKYPALSVLVITAVNRAALSKEIRQAGANDILHKPFDLEDLITAIQKLSV